MARPDDEDEDEGEMAAAAVRARARRGRSKLDAQHPCCEAKQLIQTTLLAPFTSYLFVAHRTALVRAAFSAEFIGRREEQEQWSPQLSGTIHTRQERGVTLGKL
jgi:hypothetical protein